MLFSLTIKLQIWHNRRKEVRKKGLPEIVWIGASHVRRFKEWYVADKQEFHAEDWRFLEMSGWAASGGAKFNTFNERLHGEKLPKKQRHLGDQWSEVLVKHPYPFGVVLSMGSNDVGDMYRVLMRRHMEDKKSGKQNTETRWFKWAFRLLTKHAKENTVFMKKAYPKAKLFFMSIIN